MYHPGDTRRGARPSGNTTHQTGEKSQKFTLFLDQIDTQEIIKCRPTNQSQDIYKIFPRQLG